MKKNYILLLLLLSLADLHSQMIAGVDLSNSQNSLQLSSAPATDCDVQFSFQTASSAPSGLAFDGTYLITTDLSLPFIYKYTLDGQVAATLPYPQSGGGGDLDFDGTNLWLMAEQQGILYKLNPLNGDVLNAYTISTASDPNFFSCAYDDGYLWTNDYYSVNQLLHINASTGVIEDTFNIITGILSLKIINGDLYGIDYNTDLLHKFDKETGAILSSTPWCITGYGIGLCVADSSIWGLSGSASNGGSQSIKRFESSLLSNETFAHLEPEVTILPNPASEVVRIAASNTNIISFEIFNTIGESVVRQHCDITGSVTIDVSKFQNGIYFIKVATKNGSYLKKCIKI